MNPYEILGLSQSATLEDIDRAYKELAKKHHPDLNPDSVDSSKKFKEVQSAYELLKKIKSSNSGFGEGVRFRSRSGSNDFDVNVNDFFTNSLFKGRSIQSKVELTLTDVLSGCKKEVKVKKKVICSSCSGQGFSDFIRCEECDGKGSIQIKQPPFSLNRSCNFCGGEGRINVKKCQNCSGLGYSSYEEKIIRIEVPQGVEQGSHIVVAGEGEPSLRGGQNGDLVVLVSVKNDPLFKREGANITVDVPVSYTQLVLGCTIPVPCVSKEVVSLKVPPSTQPSTKFRLKGKGLPHKGDIGDMLVCLKLEVPKNLNDDYKTALEGLSFLEKKYITVGRSGWIEKFGTSN